ncbi:MFS transporter [Bordetella sp. N]|uniref:MFS transporter n=1 Tax=Bordetella sp. N TaxID=1746199 RepID=UPI00070A7C36|nr:MFS transporter [Bordetella sp. N]ALM86274.1 multidrug MFS transporter [Bordetella sp. N]
MPAPRLSFSLQQPLPIGQGLPAADRRRAALAVMLGVCMASLDTAIANTALPAMARDLGVSEADSIWVISAYQLAMVAALLPLASLGEIIGYRRVMVAGMALFTVASLACGLSPTLPWLVGARIAQGLGGAGLMAVNIAMLRYIYSDRMLGAGVGLNSLVVGFSFAAGPTVASLILTVASWHWLFLINVPVGMVALRLCLRSLPASAGSGHRFDGVAAVFAAGFLALLVFALNEGAHVAPPRMIAISAVAALVCLLVLLRRQAGHPAPLLAVDLLKRPMFALSAATSVCTFATQSLAFVSLPFLLQSALGYSQVQTGFLITPWPVLVAALGPVAGRLSDRYSAGMLAGVGLAVLALGMVTLALMPADAGVFDICWRMALCGAGFGFFQSPNVRALMTSAPPARSGGASGMVGTVRLLGQSTGAALVAACFHASTAQGALLALWLGAAFAALASAASFMRLRFN